MTLRLPRGNLIANMDLKGDAVELKKQITDDLKQAMLKKDSVRRDTIRLLLTAVKNKEKDVRRELDEIEIRQVIAGSIKQRRDSIEQYRNAGREDLAAAEENEVEILQEFLPQALTPEELEGMVQEAIEETGAQSLKDLGKVMKAIMPKVTGRADGKQINELVRAKLA